MNTLLIAGTNTDVGKTFVTVSLAAYWQKFLLNDPQRVNSLGILKLAQTGVGDIELYRQLFAAAESIHPEVALCFAAPLAPPIAAAKEEKSIDLHTIWQSLVDLRKQHNFVLVEALGGLGSPITEELTIANIAADWHLPTVLVVPVQLGAIAQAVANVALARSSNVNLKGIILSCDNPQAEIADLTPIDLLQTLTGVPVIGILPYLQLDAPEKLATIVANWDLELILPV